MITSLLLVVIRRDEDVVVARQRAREIAAALHCEERDQAAVATAISEVARAALLRGGGSIEFLLRSGEPRQALVTRIETTGGVRIAPEAMDRQGGVGGIAAACRLMDRFGSPTDWRDHGIAVLEKDLGGAAITAAEVAALQHSLATGEIADARREIERLDRELLESLGELRRREEELVRLNQELDETNRGVVALYGELDDRADRLRQASELKTRFLSYMSHEFRTPLNSVMALATMLLDRVDGPLSPEQEKQISLIRKSASDLLAMTNDFLDLAKLEAGKAEIKPASMLVGDLFAALRGVFRPLVPSEAIFLAFDAAPDLPVMLTDEGKVSQILLNLLSNAVKFTDAGEICVTARCALEGERVHFAVRDTGIGIPADQRQRIFEEFSQVPYAGQKRFKGTGLGLPLSRKLAELLGGTLTVESQPGVGSTFRLTLPVVAPGAAQLAEPVTAPRQGAGRRFLIIDDEETSRYVTRRAIGDTDAAISESADGRRGLDEAQATHPDLIFLDLQMPELSGYEVFERLRADPATRDIPVVVVTSLPLDTIDRARLTGVRAILAKGEISRERLAALTAAE